MDNIQKASNCINIPSSQTSRSYSHIICQISLHDQKVDKWHVLNVKRIIKSFTFYDTLIQNGMWMKFWDPSSKNYKGSQ
jgi:hypothetical protein